MAPLRQIENIFGDWVEENRDKKTVELIDNFLVSLSDEYEEFEKEINSDYMIDELGKYFNSVKLRKLAENIQDDLNLGKNNEASNKVTQFRRVELGVGEGIDVLQDKEAIKKVFEGGNAPLVEYAGDLGAFFGNAFERDSFISFMAPEKRGKTFWLLDVAYRGMLQGRKVAFFEAGDMGQNQIMRRLMVRVSRHPFYKGTVKYPVRIFESGDGVRLKARNITFEKDLSWKKAVRSCKSVMQKKVKTKDSLFKISCHPNSTLRVEGIKNILRNWEVAGWMPDIILIDYADILDMSYRNMEGRDRINETWKQLRALSQTYHCLVVTATQSDSNSYMTETMGMRNFSEDKRKLAHVTGIIGLNNVLEEKEKGLMRLNWVVLRERFFNERSCVYVAGCLGIGNPAIVSYMGDF